MGPGGRAWRGVSCQLYCCAVALREFFDVPGFTQLGFRDQRLSLFRSSQVSLGAERFCFDRTNRRGLLDTNGHRTISRGSHDGTWISLGRVDGENPQVNCSVGSSPPFSVSSVLRFFLVTREKR